MLRQIFKVIDFVAFAVILLSVMAIESIINTPYIIPMIIAGCWLCLVAYANRNYYDDDDED